MEILKKNNKKVFEQLDSEIKISNSIKKMEDISKKAYLPKPNKDGIIPENDTFLGLKELDMNYYKSNPGKI
jgi:hypothetical glycosyl hydrolase